MTIYLYVKTHNKTGLKYLGKTEQEPYSYKGSGVYWMLHISKHGYDVTTEILHECSTTEELKEWGLYYSRLWNVVESNEWANLKEECGDGLSSSDAKRMMSNPLIIEKISNVIKELIEKEPWRKEKLLEMSIELWKNPQRVINQIEFMKNWWTKERRDDQSERTKKMWEDEEYARLMSNIFIKMWQNEEYRENKIQQLREYYLIPENNKMISERFKKVWEDETYREFMKERMSGKNNPNYDSTVYYFVHDNGTEEHCTRHFLYTKYNLSPNKVTCLITGVRRSHKGWRLIEQSSINT